MKEIRDYPIPFEGWEFELEIPREGALLSVAAIREKHVLSVVIDPGAQVEARRFLLQTSHAPFPYDRVNLWFVSSFQREGVLYHLFEHRGAVSSAEPPVIRTPDDPEEFSQEEVQRRIFEGRFGPVIDAEEIL